VVEIGGKRLTLPPAVPPEAQDILDAITETGH
jgi:hypothetical protein